MSSRLFSLVVVCILPSLALAQKKEILELQREMAGIQDQVRTLQRSFDEKMSALTVMVQQSLDASNNANRSVAVLESKINDRLREQTSSVGQPVATLGTKVDRMSDDFQSVKDAVNDAVSRLGKLEQKIVDLGTAVRTMQAAPPPPAGGPTTSGGPAAGSAQVPAEKLYADAYRDTMGGKPEIALQEFTDYLKAYPTTEMAPNAQFWIGQINYDQKNWDAALKSFDLVLENYPNNSKTIDAMYMKGQTLVKMGRRTAGAQEFRDLYTKYPGNEKAAKACGQLKELGYACATPVAKKKPATRR